jgi:hypothetical protein
MAIEVTQETGTKKWIFALRRSARQLSRKSKYRPGDIWCYGSGDDGSCKKKLKRTPSYPVTI